MVEIVFIIVILSIVAGGTFEYVFRVYQNYVRVNAVDKMQTDLDLALNQITNRLSHRIKGSTIGVIEVTDSNFTALKDIEEFKNYKILEWIGVDREGMLGGWSGIISSDYRDKYELESIESNLSFANEVISTLSGVNLDRNIDELNESSVALIFPSNYLDEYNVSRYGWYNSFKDNSEYYRSYIYRVRNLDIDTFESDREFNSSLIGKIDSGGGIKNMPNKYYLAWSAYGLKLDGKSLNLCYNYRPWNLASTDSNDTNGTFQTINNGTCRPLLQNVERFRFRQDGNVIRIKICVDSSNSDEVDGEVYSFCKERSIL